MKISLIGTGQIGGTLALLSILEGFSEIILYDITEGLPQGKALDLSHFATLYGKDCQITGTNDISEITDSDICVVTAGKTRKPGMSRAELLKINSDIISEVAEGIKEHAPESFIVTVSNPLDLMTLLLKDRGDFSPERVIGMAGILDSARYQTLISDKLKVSSSTISTMVLGEHGDSMLPLRRISGTAEESISTLISEEELDELEKRTKGMGGEITSLLKTGSAFFSPAAGAMRIIKSYKQDTDELIPASVYCEGQYGIHNMYFGLPVHIGKGGIKEVFEMELTAPEIEALHKSARKVYELALKLDLSMKPSIDF